VCDCKTTDSFVIAKTILCVSLQTLLVILGLQKKPEPVCDCNYFACVIATIKLSVVAKPDCVCVVESYLVIWYMIASLSSV
jgi:hypothetical protein